MTFKNNWIQPRYYKWMAGIAVAGAIAASLTFLEQQRGTGSAPVAAGSSTASNSSGNSNADRIHELRALEQELEKKPEHPPILFRMAQLSTEMGKPADAISYLERLLKADAGNTEARLELGRILYETNDVQGSIRETSKILETNAKQVDALYNLGAIYANMNQQAMARTFWNKAVASAPASDSGKRAQDGLLKLSSQGAISQAVNAPVHPNE